MAFAVDYPTVNDDQQDSVKNEVIFVIQELPLASVMMTENEAGSVIVITAKGKLPYWRKVLPKEEKG